MQELISAFQDKLKLMSEIERYMELKDHGMTRPILIPRISVFQSKDEASAMRFYTEGQKATMTKAEKEQYETMRQKQEEVATQIWVENKLNEIGK